MDRQEHAAKFSALAERIMRDLAEHPPDPVKAQMEALAAAEARGDPWRWYCRLCGAKGEAAARDDRDAGAAEHLAATRCGRGAIHPQAEAGRLLHVWSYSPAAVATLN